MSNWTVIDETLVRGDENSLYLDAMQATAAGKSEADPLPGILSRVTARIRGAVSAGNQLDADPTKIPNSLVDLALTMIGRRIKKYLQYPLTSDEQDQSKTDIAYLGQISADKIRFEAPDTPAGDAEMQSAGGQIDQVQAGNSGNDRCSLAGL